VNLIFIRLAPEELWFEDHKNGMSGTGLLNESVTEISVTNNNYNADFSAQSP
jgi:hypothetical protein